MINTQFHKPVMLNEVMQNLAVKDGEVYVDGTFGAGGYSSAILNQADCKLIAIDRDKNVERFANQLSSQFKERFVFKNSPFSRIDKIIKEEGLSEIDGLVLDIGVSSMQLDDRERGFSFDAETKLDMRMDNTQSLSAFEVVNQYSAEELADIIYNFGDEVKARQIAKIIVAKRQIQPIATCLELAEIVRSLYAGYYKTDPATKTFQALRIFVNQELEELKQALACAPQILKKGGRLVVVSFHSLEDRIVKNFLKEQSGASKTYSRYDPENVINYNSVRNFQIITKSAITPSDMEVKANPRARSAKMRVAIKL